MNPNDAKTGAHVWTEFRRAHPDTAQRMVISAFCFGGAFGCALALLLFWLNG